MLVNTARGGLVDEAALLEAVRSGQVAAAGLDSFAVEPMAAPHPFHGEPNIVLSPHIGGVTAMPTSTWAWVRRATCWRCCDVMGGQVDFMFGTVAATSPLIASGKLRALAISSPKRSQRLPNVPTIAESVVPGYEAFEWHGVFVPSGTPPDIVARLQKAVAESLQDEDVKKRFSDVGAQPIGSTPAEFADYLKKEDARWGEVVRKGNIKLD
jgi:hypothetical protein